METYVELQSKHQKEIEALQIQWAFNQEQFDEGLIVLGITPGEPTDIELVKIHGGGFCTKETSKALKEMVTRHENEIIAAISMDPIGDGFIFSMFDYELANHEYCITMDPGPALEALGITMDMIRDNPALMHGFKKAIRAQMLDYSGE